MTNYSSHIKYKNRNDKTQFFQHLSKWRCCPPVVSCEHRGVSEERGSTQLECLLTLDQLWWMRVLHAMWGVHWQLGGFNQERLTEHWEEPSWTREIEKRVSGTLRNKWLISYGTKTRDGIAHILLRKMRTVVSLVFLCHHRVVNRKIANRTIFIQLQLRAAAHKVRNVCHSTTAGRPVFGQTGLSTCLLYGYSNLRKKDQL